MVTFQSPERRPRLIAGLVLALIVAVSTLGSLYWVMQNVVLVGKDTTGHLEQSIFIANLLQSPSLATPFQALTIDNYRPTLLYLLTQPFYWLFGRTSDAAQGVNLLLGAVILVLTYMLARRTLTRVLALFAVALLSLFPMLNGMTRLYYMENTLTVLLLVALYALLRSNGFRRQGWTLLWGGAIGLAMLAKWTAPLYLLAPILYVLGSTGFGGAQRRALGAIRIHWRRAGLAMAVGILLAWAWYLPDRAYVASQEMILGDWLPVFWSLLIACVVYLATDRSRTPLHNFWFAVSVGILIASIWYLPRINFLVRLGDVSFGTDRGTQPPLDYGRLSLYTRYLLFIWEYHLGPLATVLIVPLALFGWLRQFPQRRTATVDMIAFLLMVGVSFVILTLLAQANPRNLTPMLPAVAILLAASLRAYRPPWAAAIGAVWLLALLVQWSVYTFGARESFSELLRSLWVRGGYMTWATSGPTAPGYWIQPDVLAAIGSAPGEPERLGVLVDAAELHRGQFRYLVTNGGLNLDIIGLTDQDDGGWSKTLANRWLLVSDGRIGTADDPVAQAVVERILNGDAFFHQLYAPVASYALPSGDTATLYHRDGPADPQAFPVLLLEAQPIAEALNQLWPAQGTLIFGDRNIALWVGIQDLRAEHVWLPPRDGDLAELPQQLSGTVFVVSRYNTDASNAAVATGYYAREIRSGDTTVEIMGFPNRPLTSIASAQPWAAITLDQVRSWTAVAPGEVLPVELQATSHTDQDLKLSVRLVDAAGNVVAQNDVSTATPASFGLYVPPDTPAGAYWLAGVLYDAATMTNLGSVDGAELGKIAPLEVTRPDDAAE